MTDAWVEYYDRSGWSGDPALRPRHRACNCIGPQRGAPVCPCAMASVKVLNGRYVTIIDHGPAPTETDQETEK